MGVLDVLSGILDAYENTRKDTKKQEKKETKNYDYESGFTGSKKDDFKKIKTPTVKPSKKPSTKAKEVDDGQR